MGMFFYTTMGMGIRSWKWEGMGSKKSFPFISTIYDQEYKNNTLDVIGSS